MKKIKDKDLINYLENQLDLAKASKIRGFIGASVAVDGPQLLAYTSNAKHSLTLMGLVEHSKQMLIKDLEENYTIETYPEES